MNGSATSSPNSAAAGKHAQALSLLQQRLSADTNIERQLRLGGEPGLLDTTGVDDETLMRWLRAEKYDVDKAFTRLQSHAKWRSDYVPNGRIEETSIQAELDARKSFLQGLDKKGRPVSICMPKNHKKSTRVLDQTKRLIAYALDNCIKAIDTSQNPTGKTVAIFDLRGLTLDSMDRQVLQAVFDLLQNHYPERLAKLWMYEAPTMFWGLWQLVSPFIDPETKSKVVFVSSKTAIKEFQEAIDLSVLPKEFGGNAELIPVQDYVQKHLLTTKTGAAS